MVDSLDRPSRSRLMASVRSKDTAPEVAVRKALHARGFRYRTHAAELPGKPDIVLPKYQATLLVHGCFWHGHHCSLFQLPATRTEFWNAKIRRNRERDAEVRNALRAAGWRCLTVWECALRGPEKREFVQLIDDVAAWLRSPRVAGELRGERSAMAPS